MKVVLQELSVLRRGSIMLKVQYQKENGETFEWFGKLNGRDHEEIHAVLARVNAKLIQVLETNKAPPGEILTFQTVAPAEIQT